MAFFTSDSIYLADLYQFSDQRGGVDSYNIKQLSPNVAYKKPPSSETLKQPRQSHNLVEKRYRSRLKNHFESLLAVLPVPLSKDGNHGDNCDLRFSRAEVLVSARDRIVSLEEGFEAMAKERDQLLTHIDLMYEFTY
ncbi:hypothetical protein HYE67_005151 [Fusarium culmorum]|uniref:BHLH domain-containing protein n=1 Tax=Fusarium culmorum TaxID=5516 RepID=A0A2T4GY43_FUSCU|nr:hypothetical protein FCULG_00012538 [Fusarium culmorum]QPC62920.1 hypothetical protein HYE67_005151 [Fusarium culmorum]